MMLYRSKTIHQLIVLTALVVIPQAVGAQQYLPRQLTHNPEQSSYPSWSPDDSIIAYNRGEPGSRDIWTIPADGGESTRITYYAGSDCTPDWSPDGSALVFASDRSGNDDIWVYRFADESFAQITSHVASDCFPQWSPDGSEIAFCSFRSGSPDIWKIPAAGGTAVQITNESGLEIVPAWSPDGSQIAFMSDIYGNPDLWTISSDGTGDPFQITTHSDYDSRPRWSPDGVEILFLSGRSGYFNLWRVPATGGTAVQVTSGAVMDGYCDWSSNGDYIAFGSDRSGYYNIWVMPMKQFTRITEGPHVNDGKGSDGACWIDYDDDGFLDIYVPNNALLGPENNSLYRNNGDGTYTEITGLSIVNDSTRTGKATWADYDNDGDMDLIWTVLEYTEVGILCENNGGSFEQVIPSPFSDASVLSTSISWTDYDVDNLLDIFIGNAYALGVPSRDFLYKGNGETFTEITTGPLVTRQKYTYCASWSDYDNDMLPDLVSPGNVEFLTELYHNDGGGLFTYDAASDVCQSIASGAGASWADYDNDGDMDLFMGTAAPGSAYLYQSDGEGALTEVVDHGLEMSFGRIYGGSWADYDNDGDEDIVIWSNIYSYPDPDYDSGLAFMYENVDGSFYRQSDTLMFFGDRIIKAIIWGDSDRDGDLDLYAPMAELYSEGADNVFYENIGNSNNWITIKPIGTVSNRSAIGAKVRLRSNIGGSLTWQMRELTSMVGTGWQPPLEAHFGLGDATIIDSIKIEWPSGIVQVMTDVDANQFLTIIENCCDGLTGNVDNDAENIVDIGDLTALIDYLFISYEGPFCMAEANTDGEGTVDIGDLTALIDYLFISYTPLESCH